MLPKPVIDCISSLCASREPSARAELVDELRILVRGVELERDSYRRTVLDLIAQGPSAQGLGDLVRELAAAGVDINKSGRAGDLPPLYAACQRGNADVVDALLAFGAKQDIPVVNSSANLNGAKPIHVAVTSYRKQRAEDYARIIEALLSHGADINEPDRSGAKPIDIVISSFVSTKDNTLLEALLRAGVHVNKKTGSASPVDLLDAVSENMHDGGRYAAMARHSEVSAVLAEVRDEARKDAKPASRESQPGEPDAAPMQEKAQEKRTYTGFKRSSL